MTKYWSVDPQSFDLAKHFLPTGTQPQLQDLSQDIQDAVEDWFNLHPENNPNHDPTPWCSGCGAMKQKDCHCGPIAEND